MTNYLTETQKLKSLKSDILLLNSISKPTTISQIQAPTNSF
jgi:hypothetical protein